MLNERDLVILYVEDEPLSREVMEMFVKGAMGVEEITIFDDSRDIIERIKSLNPQPTIIFLDIHMKPHDGFEVLSMLREQRDYQDVKVVACTASVMNEEIEMLKRADFDGCIGKPIDIDLFPQFVDRIMSGERVWHVT
jgi:two-component system cell cycle response regulator DivK